MTLPEVEPSIPAGLRYRLVLPEGWLRLPADPVALRPAARAVIAERFAGLPRDSTAQLRRELEDELVALADTASGQFAVDLLLLTSEVAGRPLSASCVVSIVPVPLDGPVALAELVEDSADGALSSEILQLGRHTGVRVVRDELPSTDPAAERPPGLDARIAEAVRDTVGPDAVTAVPATRPSRLVDVFLPVPDSAVTLLLSFSTAVRPLFDPLTELFTAIAATVQFRAEDEPWR